MAEVGRLSASESYVSCRRRLAGFQRGQGLAGWEVGGHRGGIWGAVNFHLEAKRNVAQLPCFVMAVHCAVHPGNIKLPVLCIKLQDLPWICDFPRSSQMLHPVLLFSQNMRLKLAEDKKDMLGVTAIEEDCWEVV